MLNVFKKLFGKSSAPVATPPTPPPAKPVTPAAPAAPSIKSALGSTAPAAPAPAAVAPAPAPVPPGADAITITLKSTVAGMPDSIKKRLDKTLSGAETFQISYAEALRQLPTGAVKIPFREIVRMVPNTFLTPDEEMLNTQISLPLGEILPRVKNLPRRASQRQVEVPSDIEGMFGGKGDQFKAKKVEVAPPSNIAGTAPIPASTGGPPVRPPTAAPVPRPAPAPTPTPTSAPAPAAAKTAEYVPPAPKPLEPQAPISFKMPGEAAPAPAPAQITPIAPKAPEPAPIPIPAPAPTPAAKPPAQWPLPVPSPPGSTPPPQTKAAFAPPPAAPVPLEVPSISLGEIFGEPGKTNWTPQEVVQKATSLRGVAGAIITTEDGLPVAFQLPEHLNGNVIGAFVPQMFTRITQYTRDLKLGDAKQLTLIVENVPLQIFKSGKIFFTALGKPNENLPKPQLTAIAANLARQL